MKRHPLRSRIRWLTGLLIVGLLVSGLTAMPLLSEFNWLIEWLGLTQPTSSSQSSMVSHWFWWVHDGLAATHEHYPFMFYGTDWLAFGHLVMALVFVGAWRDPVRNIWLFQIGLIACALVIPFALLMGEARGIPMFWRLIDCGFGLAGAVPLTLGWRWTKQLDSLSQLDGMTSRPRQQGSVSP